MRRMRIPCHSPKRPTRRKKRSRLRCNLHNSSCQEGPRLPGKFLQRIAAASTSFRRFCGSVRFTICFVQVVPSHRAKDSPRGAGSDARYPWLGGQCQGLRWCQVLTSICMYMSVLCLSWFADSSSTFWKASTDFLIKGSSTSKIQTLERLLHRASNLHLLERGSRSVVPCCAFVPPLLAEVPSGRLRGGKPPWQATRHGVMLRAIAP